MSKCIQCGSYAINPHLHGRDGTDLDLCDVCYWRKRAIKTADVLREVREKIARSCYKSCFGDDYDGGLDAGLAEGIKVIDDKIKELEP